MEILSSKTIEDKILKNYFEYQYYFVELQSKFLSGLYSKYQNIDNGNLVLYYEKQTHQNILRKKDYDFNFNISLEKFWENHSESNPTRKSLIKIAKDTLLPKETVRRKILELLNKKVLNKKNRSVEWLPNEQHKQSYNLFVNEEIEDIIKLLNYICKKLDYNISKEELEKEIKEKFSFYWFHYLGAQLEYLKIWSKQLNDLEFALILMKIVHVFTRKVKEENISHKKIFDNPSLLKNFISANVSATSISEITKIPRATCVRKLGILVKLKVISQDPITKRYYVLPEAVSKDLISRKITQKVVTTFSNFFFICIRAIKAKK